MNKPPDDTSKSGREPSAASPPGPQASDPEDGAWVERAVQGDAEAFERLYVKHRQRAFGLAWRILKDEEAALDVVQDAFVRAYQQLGGLRGETRFYPWLRRIVVNLAIDHLRHQKRGVEVAFDERQFGTGDEVDGERQAADVQERAERESPSRQAELAEFSADLQAALMQLSAAHRAVFLLHAAEGMTYQEIAEALNCNIGTVMSRLFYARRQLQKRLAPHLEGEGG